MPNIRLNRLYPFNARFEFTDIWAWLNFKFLICTKLNKIKCKTEIEKIYSRLFKQDYSSKIIQARLFKQDDSGKLKSGFPLNPGSLFFDYDMYFQGVY